MNRSRAPSLIVFAVASVVVHASSFFGLYALGRRATMAPQGFDTTAQTLVGDTLDVEQAEAPSSDDYGELGAADPATPPPHEPSGASASRRASARPLDAAPRSGSADARAAPVSLFGAVGVRYAADLASSFTRAFPQAASADPLWASARFGAAGVADVTLFIDDEGRLSGVSITGAPSVALRRGIERAVALLGARPFTARGAATHLRLRARVSRDDVHDGLHGDVFALSGGSFAGDVGTAFFALPPAGGTSGRRVDVELRLLP